MSSEAVNAILFGKLPAHGDFIARGLSLDARLTWDAWLAAEMGQAQAAHGDAFRERFDHAPVWRFAVREGDAFLCGALAASSDTVGRRFPIVAARRTGRCNKTAAAACEEHIYAALSNQWRADRLQAEIAAMVPDETGSGDAAGWWTPGNDLFPALRAEGERPGGLLTLMLTPQDAAA